MSDLRTNSTYSEYPTARPIRDPKDRILAHEDCLNCRCTNEQLCAGTEPRPDNSGEPGK